MPPHPQNLYSIADARAFDAHAIEELHIPAYELMCRAGATALAVAQQRWPGLRSACVVCGPGNNGGDGLVFARLAREAGIEVEVACVGGQAGGGAAAQARKAWQDAGGQLTEFDGALPRVDLVVDALLGIGLSRPAEGEARQAVNAINSSRSPVLALDVPSGVNADTGAVPGEAVHATLTVTFIVHKRGLHTGPALDHCGEVILGTLDLPPEILAGHTPAASLIRPDFAAAKLAPRQRDCHKGDFGHVLVIGGSPGFGGAPALTGEAALRSGAGLVSVATHPGETRPMRPELMVHTTGTADELAPLIERSTVIVIGPGLGLDDRARALLKRALASGKPLVVDADALTLLAGSDPVTREDWILTPHPGEAGRLLATDPVAVQADRYGTAAALAERHSAVVVLKGAGTIVAASGRSAGVCGAGNPGMASGGMGDVLAGVIAALRAQRLDAFDAAKGGVMLHARAADLAAAHGGYRGLLATDLFAPLQSLVNGHA